MTPAHRQVHMHRAGPLSFRTSIRPLRMILTTRSRLCSALHHNPRRLARRVLTLTQLMSTWPHPLTILRDSPNAQFPPSTTQVTMHGALVPMATRHNMMFATNDVHWLLHNHRTDVRLATGHALARHEQAVHYQLHRAQIAHRHPARHLMISDGFWQLGTWHCLRTDVSLRFSSSSWVPVHHLNGSLDRTSSLAASPRSNIHTISPCSRSFSQLRTGPLRVQRRSQPLMRVDRLL